MKALDVLKKIKQLNSPVFKTSDIAALLQIPLSHAAKILTRCQMSEEVIKINRGNWALSKNIDPLLIPGLLTTPWPCYISLQTALYYHHMIEQIPETIYAVSLSRTKDFNTPFGTCSIHQASPGFFFDFENKGFFNLATKEKALIDFFYFSLAKSLLFYRLPELEIPDDFDYKHAERIITKIKNPSRRRWVFDQFSAYNAKT